MKVDIHTHILPGIDDGAKDWDTCTQMLAKSAECGVKAVIATPHCFPWHQRATAEVVKQLCQEAQEKILTKLGISMDIYAGHEIYYNLEVVESLKKGEILTLAGSRYVLVEFSPQISYQMICRAVKDFRDGGYVPILAHVERYWCLHEFGKMGELKERGALFQMNVGAFQGNVFNAESRWSKKCLLGEFIDFLASDMHNIKERPPLSEERLNWVRKKLDLEYQEKLLCNNGKKIIL